MHFDPSYFEGEERDGFYIRPMVKRAWAAQLKVLQEVDKICKRHNIQYYAEYGTLLGAVRHKGFIPWDDDLDIGMTRDNYVRFAHYAPKELPQDYRLFSVKTNAACTELVNRVVNSPKLDTHPSFTEQYYGCPYVIGIDIFVTDRIPMNKNEEQLQISLLNAANSLGRYWDDDSMTEEEKWGYLENLEEVTKVKIDRNKNIPQQLLVLSDQICAMYWDVEATEMTLIPKLSVNPDYRLPISVYQAPIIELPFENIMIPALASYDQILTRRYGPEYMTPRQYSNHDYPFFKEQEKMLFEHYEKIGLPVPECFKE